MKFQIDKTQNSNQVWQNYFSIEHDVQSFPPGADEEKCVYEKLSGPGQYLIRNTGYPKQPILFILLTINYSQ